MNDRDSRKTDLVISAEDKVLIYLVGCALNGLVPDEKVYSGASMEEVHDAAVRHSLISMVSHALELCGYKGISDELAERFRKTGYKAVRKTILLDVEREAILSYMEGAGIKYMPLKGVIIGPMYPGAGMRQMTDNDILYDVSYRKNVMVFMESMGYRAKMDMAMVHDCYYKEPVYNYEMHARLFSEALKDGAFAGYFEGVWDRAILDDDKMYGYRMTDEDFYIYMTAHAYKHYQGAGTGVRTLADSYVMNRELAEMDRDYVDEELHKLGLTEFERGMRELADKLFTVTDGQLAVFDDLKDEERAMLDHMLNSGAYGTTENKVMSYMRIRGIEGDLTGSKRFVYCFKRLFPSRKILMPSYPLARYRILLPAVWIFRIMRAVLTKPETITGEVGIVKRIEKL